MSNQIKLRRGLSTVWYDANPLLSAGEQGFETDTKKIKIGDGVTYWRDLNYWTFGFATVASSGNANDLVGTILASTVVSSSLTSVGTLTGLTISGTLAANGSGGITTTQTGTVPLFNTNATGINLGGSATTVSIGAGTGTTTVNNALTVTGTTTASGTLAVNGTSGITTTQTTFPLVDSTATTVNFAGAATTLTIGNATSATVTLRPGTLVGTNTTQNVYNTVATTVNAFGEATTISLGAGTGTTTVNNNLTITGNLDVKGTTSYIESTTLQVLDKNIEIAKVANPTDTTANGAGITILGATNKTLNWVSSTPAWTSSENFDLASGKTYKIGTTDVLSSTTLGSTVVSSSLTSVGTLTNLTVTNTITGSVSGNAGTVTSGVYTTGSYADPSWITSLAASKLTGNNVISNGVYNVTVGSGGGITVASNTFTVTQQGTGNVSALSLIGNGSDQLTFTTSSTTGQNAITSWNNAGTEYKPFTIFGQTTTVQVGLTGATKNFVFNADGSFSTPFFSLPASTGTPSQVLVTDGNGHATWQTPGAASGVVSYVTAQTLTSGQKAQARSNINAASPDDSFINTIAFG